MILSISLSSIRFPIFSLCKRKKKTMKVLSFTQCEYRKQIIEAILCQLPDQCTPSVLQRKKLLWIARIRTAALVYLFTSSANALRSTDRLIRNRITNRTHRLRHSLKQFLRCITAPTDHLIRNGTRVVVRQSSRFVTTGKFRETVLRYPTNLLSKWEAIFEGAILYLVSEPVIAAGFLSKS